jgi:hypothetical protein
MPLKAAFRTLNEGAIKDDRKVDVPMRSADAIAVFAVELSEAV